MKLNTKNIPVIAGQYIDAEVAPKTSDLGKFCTYGMLFAASARLPGVLEKYAPTMKMLGIMDNDGFIDLEYTHNMAKSAAERTGKINVLGFVMDAQDVEKIYAIASQFGE